MNPRTVTWGGLWFSAPLKCLIFDVICAFFSIPKPNTEMSKGKNECASGLPFPWFGGWFKAQTWGGGCCVFQPAGNVNVGCRTDSLPHAFTGSSFFRYSPPSSSYCFASGCAIIPSPRTPSRSYQLCCCAASFFLCRKPSFFGAASLYIFKVGELQVPDQY